MKYQILRDGKGMTTDSLSCMPTPEVAKNMYDAGYRFKIDGKAVSCKIMLEMLEKQHKTTGKK